MNIFAVLVCVAFIGVQSIPTNEAGGNRNVRGRDDVDEEGAKGITTGPESSPVGDPFNAGRGNGPEDVNGREESQGSGGNSGSVENPLAGISDRVRNLLKGLPGDISGLVTDLRNQIEDFVSRILNDSLPENTIRATRIGYPID